MDYVGKFENFERDVNNLFEYLKLPIPDSIAHYYDYEKNPPADNEKKERKHYTEYYTEQWMIDAVAEREKFVIEKFSYEYGKDGDRWR